MPRVITIIPARMQATRLPGKPLADIAGKPMIVHVWERAMAAETGRVAVATDNDEIAAAVRNAGGEAVMTRADHASGSDRVFEAASRLDPDGDADTIVNLQGDLPTLDPLLVRACLAPLSGTKATDIATLAAEITVEEEKTNPNVVKAVGTPLSAPNHLRALYFTRATAPYGEGPLYHHIGIYAYRRQALERFVSLAPRHWRRARSSSSCARLRRGCGSILQSSTPSLWAWTRPQTWSGPATSLPAPASPTPKS